MRGKPQNRCTCKDNLADDICGWDCMIHGPMVAEYDIEENKKFAVPDSPIDKKYKKVNKEISVGMSL